MFGALCLHSASATFFVVLKQSMLLVCLVRLDDIVPLDLLVGDGVGQAARGEVLLERGGCRP